MHPMDASFFYEIFVQNLLWIKLSVFLRLSTIIITILPELGMFVNEFFYGCFKPFFSLPRRNYPNRL